MKMFSVWRLLSLMFLLGLSMGAEAQIVWQEAFSYPNGTVTGANLNTANPAADWTSGCPTCAAGDWFEVRSGKMECNDTNGPATMETESIDISSLGTGAQITIDLEEQGDMEDCPGGISSGCNAVDWIRVEYKLDNAPYVDVGSPLGGLCTGPCAGDVYFAIGNFNSTIVNICPLIGDSLRIRISVQTWAAAEYLRIDNIVVQGQLCAPPTGTDSVVNVSCNGANDGEIWIAASGNAPFTYSLNGGPFQNSNFFTGLAAGTYSVVIRDQNGLQTTLSGIVITQPNPINFTGVAVSPLCVGGTDGQITATSVSGGTAPYQYGLGGPPFQTANTFGNLGAGTYNLIVQDSLGCTDTVPVTINDPAAIALTLTATASGCTTATGTATVGASGGTPSYSYTWSTTPVQTTATATGLAVGSYSVTVTDQNNCSVVGNVTVPGAGAPTVTAAPDVSFCLGQGNAQLGATITGGQGPYTYVWWCDSTNPPCALDSANDNDPIATPNATTTYYVQVTDAGGCVSGIDSVRVTLLALPTANAGIDTAFCPGQGVELNGSGIGTAPFSFEWTCDSTLTACNIDSLQDDDPFVSPTLGTTYYLQVTDANGCVSAWDSVEVSLLPIPTAEAGTGDSICPGDTTRLSGSGSGGNNFTYLWTPSASLDNPTSAQPQAFPLTSTWYYLTVTADGCPSLADSVWVEVNYAPVVFAGNDTTICLGDSVILIGQTTGLPTTYTYEWRGPGGVLNLDGSDTITVRPTQTSSYFFTAFPPAGCASLPDTITITVEQPFVHDRPDNVEFCPGEPVLLGVTAQTGFEYQWFPYTGLDVIDQSQTMAWGTESIVYTFTVTDPSKLSENCRTQEFEVVLSAGDCLLPNVFSPNGDGINDVLDLGPYFNSVELHVFDRWGKEVYANADYQNDWRGQTKGGVDLPDGVYYYTVKANWMGTGQEAEANPYQKAHSITLLR